MRLKPSLFNCTTMEEIWKDIKGFEGYYQVSNLGRVKSLSRKKQHSLYGYQNQKERIIKQVISNSGYFVCGFHRNKKRINMSVHRVIAETFIPNPDNKPYVNHKNGIKTDNRIENLEWCTAKENIVHAHKIGLYSSNKGEKNNSAKLNEKEVKFIRELILNGNKISSIALKFNVSFNTIKSIKDRKSWNHI